MKWTTIKLGAAAGVLAFGLLAGTAQAKETVKIAFIGPLTGGASSIGLGGRNSAQLAVRLRNDDPDAKYEYDLVTLDDACKPNVGVQVATKAAADRDIVGAITQYCSSVAMAAVNVYHRFQLPVIVWGAVLPDITYANDYAEVHRVNGTMINQNETAAQFMTDKGYKKWVIIHDTTDYGKGHNQYFSRSLKENGGEILGTFGVSSDQQDFTAELTQARSMNPDVIYFGGLTPVGVRIRRQMERLGIEAQFEGTSGIISDSYIDGLGDLAEGTVAFLEGAPLSKLPGGEYFKTQYDEAGFSEPAEAYGPFAFAATTLLMDTIAEVGPDRRKITQALAEVKDADSIVGKIRFDDHGQNEVAQITKYVVEDGEWVVWEDSEYASGERQLTGM
ncbi:Leucine-, isoleucine-, valine-, threonine-, and alanine-binding protein [Salinisphaera shabanensis T35B1]|uniref:branched-chain amino acid ABC transporter substrate-binding protein n=1 Tax=Salinisphaera shabanensis TaxID=180542 RepID=UPI0033400CBD